MSPSRYQRRIKCNTNIVPGIQAADSKCITKYKEDFIMCDELRVHSTSFRYSDSVQNVLDSVNKKTTADKIEFICLDFEQNKSLRELRIKELDNQINEKRKQLDLLSNKVWNMKDVTSSLENLVNNLKKCIT